MTTQYAVFSGLPTGLTLTAKLFTLADPDTVAYTSDSTTNRTNAKDEYVFTFGEAAAISGNHTLKVLNGTNVIGTGKRTFAGTDTETATETGVTAVLDSASRLAIWNTLTTESFTADSFGELLLISDGTNGREVKVTGSHHIAADVHDCQADGLSASTEITAVNTFATRVTTGIVQDGAVWQFTANMLELGPSGGGSGSATLEKQEEILAAIQGTEVIQVASPNVNGNLVLTQGDDYDGTANPRAQWTVTTDYTSGWTVALTIRNADDAVVYTTSGTVVSATVIAVTIAAPTGLTMTGCPGQWQGKFDVQLTHTATGKKKTIALGVCYINEDQTR